MNIRNFLLLLTLVLVQGLSAKNPTVTFHMPRLVYEGATSCNLSPPSDLNVDNVGTDWVDVSWPAVLGADQYQLQAFDGVTGDPLGPGPLFVPGTATSATVSTAGNGGNFYVRIWSVCEDGTLSDDYTESPLTDTIIIEIVGSGFTPLNNPKPDCPIGYTGTECNIFTWDNTETPFCVIFSRPGNPTTRRSFSLTVKNMDGGPDYVDVHPESLTAPLLFFTTNNEGTSLEIRYQSTSGPILQTMTVEQETAGGSGPGHLLLTGGANPYCKVYRLVEGPQEFRAPTGNGSSAGNASNERSLTPESALRLSIKPNPFHEALTVQWPESNNQNGANLYLYDLLGAVKRTFTASAGQHECTLNTNDLEPGVYFLRIESGGDVQTIKVVKTQ